MAKASADPSMVRDFSKNTPFVQLTYELMSSDAWRSMSINCRKLVDCLILEHMRHSGSENGNLITTYDQFEEYGVTRKNINKAKKMADDIMSDVSQRISSISYDIFQNEKTIIQEYDAVVPDEEYMKKLKAQLL